MNNHTTAFRFMIIGLFMAVLDIQVVASSIGELQAALSASMDEISWVQTAYLIAEVIMIPICGWLSDALSTRILFVASALIFTLASGACALAWNLNSMIAFRVIQGFFGGAMIPTVFSCVYIMFPRNQQTQATIQAGMVATTAPTLGPTLGGWITTHISWHWLFLINIIPGLVVSYGVWRTLHIDQPNLKLFQRFDWQGIVFAALSLGLLELFLKEGHRLGWSSALTLRILVGLCLASMAFFIRELTHANPIIPLRSFKDRNFAIGCALSFAVGVGLYGAVYLLPMTLTVIRHYNSLQIGQIMFFTGIFQFLSGPIAGKLEPYLDKRIMLAMGLTLFGISLLANSRMTPEVDLHSLFWPQLLRGFSIMFCFLPMTAIALGRLPAHQVKQSSGLYNLMRNLGGAIGIALIDTVFKHHTQVALTALASHVTEARLATLPMPTLATPILDPERLMQFKLTLLHMRALKQACLIGFNQCFATIGVYLLACAALITGLRKAHD